MKKYANPNSEPRTPNSEMQPEPKCNTPWPWPLHMVYPSAPICFLLSYCLEILVVLVVLTLAYVRNPPLYCLALVLFRMYLAKTLPTCLMFCLAWNYKVLVSCIYSTIRISKLSGSSLRAIKSRTHSDSCSWTLAITSDLALLISLNLAPEFQTSIRNN